MGRRVTGLCAALLAAGLAFAGTAGAQSVRVKDVGRFQSGPESAVVGYGVVMGLAGSGDSPRNEVTQQALRNVLSRFGANVTTDQVRSRNVAVVMVTATIPATAKAGDHLDISVASIGDARSLLGGTLLATPLAGADARTYAVGQGPVVVGGYRFDADRNVEQKNHPTSGIVPGGATIENEAQASLGGARGLLFVLADADVTTAGRVADALNQALGPGAASIRDAKSVWVRSAGTEQDNYRLISRVEALSIRPDAAAKVVVNERSGTVVAGGGVQISSVVISQGDVKVSVKVENSASQPLVAGGYAPDLRSLVVSNTKLAVADEPQDAVISFPNTTVSDLVQGLSRVHVRTREMIAILQAMRAAGALHAEIVVQ
jgi:flagellar P-ring protein precursor FlgI